MNPKLTPFEQQLQQYAPEVFTLIMLMKDAIDGGGGEKKLLLLIDTILKINDSRATGAIMIDFSKGKIANIDVRTRITAETSLTK